MWCYKTTKESLDRVDRKFTQLTVDRYMLGQLNKRPARFTPKAQVRYRELLREFQDYIAQKEYKGVCALVAFSGELTIDGQVVTESQLNEISETRAESLPVNLNNPMTPSFEDVSQARK